MTIKSVKVNGYWTDIDDLRCSSCGDVFGSNSDSNYLIEFHGDYVCDNAGCKHEAIMNYSGDMLVFDELHKTEISDKYPDEIF